MMSVGMVKVVLVSMDRATVVKGLKPAKAVAEPVRSWQQWQLGHVDGSFGH